jgi:hypothetical protein
MVGDTGIAQGFANTDTFALVVAFPTAALTLRMQTNPFPEAGPPIDFAIRASFETRAIFSFAVRTEHEKSQELYHHNYRSMNWSESVGARAAQS